jgi:uncharacterized membrane protein
MISKLSHSLNRLMTLMFWLALIAIFIMPALRFFSLGSNIADMGFFMSNMLKIPTRWEVAIQGHFQPLFYIYAPLYNLFNLDYSPYLLLLSQSAAIAYSAILIRRNFGIIAGFAMVFYYPLWVNALFDFHFDHLMILLSAIFFVSVKKNRILFATISAVLMSLVKEPYALTTAFCGIYLLVLGLNIRRDKNPIRLRCIGSGFLLIFFGAGYFYITIDYLMPLFEPSLHGGYGISSPAFSWLGNDLVEIVMNLVTNPIQILLSNITEPRKALYFSLIFGLVGFLSILKPRALLVAFPVLFISFLSKEPGYFDYANHYSAGAIVPIIVSFSDGFKTLRYFIASIDKAIHLNIRNSKIGLSLKIVVIFLILSFHIIIAQSPIARLFWSDKVWAYNYKIYVPDSRDIHIKKILEQYLPEDESVIVSSQNNINSSQISNRDRVFIFPTGAIDHYPVPFLDVAGGRSMVEVLNNLSSLAIDYDYRYADYVVLDFERPYFINDKGCEWLYGGCSDKAAEAEFHRLFFKTIDNYKVEHYYDGFFILKRKNDISK